MIFACIVFCALAAILLIQWRKSQRAFENYLQLGDTVDELKEQKRRLSNELQDTQTKVDELRKEKNVLTQLLEQQKDFTDKQEETIANLRKSYETRYKMEENLGQAKLQEIAAKYNDQKEKQQKTYEESLAVLEEQWKDEYSRYMAAIRSAQNSLDESEENAKRHIHLADNEKEDIAFLFSNVANRLSNPNVLYKLIWSEYVQKPASEMVKFVCPIDCAGIYKITNDKNKKAYIGRSVSVRKRLNDHIKSAIGIDTIADQYIHQVMREEGIWNFTFELIEECEKDKLNEREKYYISTFQTEQFGYNQKAGG